LFDARATADHGDAELYHGDAGYRDAGYQNAAAYHDADYGKGEVPRHYAEADYGAVAEAPYAKVAAMDDAEYGDAEYGDALDGRATPDREAEYPVYNEAEYGDAVDGRATLDHKAEYVAHDEAEYGEVVYDEAAGGDPFGLARQKEDTGTVEGAISEAEYGDVSSHETGGGHDSLGLARQVEDIDAIERAISEWSVSEADAQLSSELAWQEKASRARCEGLEANDALLAASLVYEEEPAFDPHSAAAAAADAALARQLAAEDVDSPGFHRPQPTFGRHPSKSFDDAALAAAMEDDADYASALAQQEADLHYAEAVANEARDEEDRAMAAFYQVQDRADSERDDAAIAQTLDREARAAHDEARAARLAADAQKKQRDQASVLHLRAQFTLAQRAPSEDNGAASPVSNDGAANAAANVAANFAPTAFAPKAAIRRARPRQDDDVSGAGKDEVLCAQAAARYRDEASAQRACMLRAYDTQSSSTYGYEARERNRTLALHHRNRAVWLRDRSAALSFASHNAALLGADATVESARQNGFEGLLKLAVAEGQPPCRRRRWPLGKSLLGRVS